MDGLSIAHWIILLIYIAVVVTFFVSTVRILNRLGYSGWWSLLAIVPIANVIALWKLSKAHWPIEKR
jgi:uncharacterized membrane protein YhaH (DUF805 family)